MYWAGRGPRFGAVGAMLKPECLRAGNPTSGWAALPRFHWLDVLAGRVHGRAAVDLFPDVVRVVTLAQRRDDGCRLIPRQPERNVP